MKDPEQEIADFLHPYSEEIRSLAQALRTYLKEETKPAFELAGKSAQSFNIGYGFTSTSWDCFCAIIVYRNHINISLPSGSSLRDPERILHGTGSRVRHIKIKGLEDLQTPVARQILIEAREKALFLMRNQEIDHEGVTTVIKTKKSK